MIDTPPDVERTLRDKIMARSNEDRFQSVAKILCSLEVRGRS